MSPPNTALGAAPLAFRPGFRTDIGVIHFVGIGGIGMSGIAEVMARKGLTFRRIPDPAGDASICTVLFMRTPEQAQAVVDALRAENIGASRLYERAKRDLHVYAHWTPVLNKRSWGSTGPWDWAQREIEYDHDMCPRSLDYLGRAVHLDVSPLLTNEDVEETVEGLNRVLTVLG